MPDFAYRPVTIIRGYIHQKRHTPRTIPFELNFFVGRTGKFACSALDGTLDIVSGHVLSFGRGNGGTQAWIPFRVAPATFGGHGDFLDQASKDLAALGVQRALFVLDC